MDEVAGLQDIQGILQLRRRPRCLERLERSPPEHLADHRRVEQRTPGGGGKRVEPRGDRGPHVGGSFSVASSTRSASEATSSSMNSGLPSAVITTRSAAPCSPESSIGSRFPASVRASSKDSGCSCIEVCDISRAPQGPGVQELRAGLGQKHDRDVANAGGQVLQQVQLAGVGPVDVFEHQQERLPARQLLHEPAGREEQRLAIGHSVPAEADQERQLVGNLGAVRTAQLGDHCRQLRPGVGGGSLSKIPATS